MCSPEDFYSPSCHKEGRKSSVFLKTRRDRRRELDSTLNDLRLRGDAENGISLPAQLPCNAAESCGIPAQPAPVLETCPGGLNRPGVTFRRRTRPPLWAQTGVPDEPPPPSFHANHKRTLCRNRGIPHTYPPRKTPATAGPVFWSWGS